MSIETPLRAQRDRDFARDDAPAQPGLFADELAFAADDRGVPTAASALGEDDSYKLRYGLQEDPFTNDYSFPLFTGAQRRELLDKLLHLVQFSDSLLGVTGTQGVGKTRAAHAFMDSLSDQDLLSYLPIDRDTNTQLILSAIVDDFGLDLHGEPIVENLAAALDLWLTLPATVPGQLACVVIDNAHLLASDTLERIAALLRRHPEQKRLHFVLFGEAGLSLRLQQLSQQGLPVNHFTLAPLQLAETVDYLNFRMEMADYLGPEFFNEAMVSGWWRQADGDLAFIHERAREQLTQSVITPSGAVVKARPLPLLHIIAISALIAAAGVALLYLSDDAPESGSKAVILPVPKGGVDLTKTETPTTPVLPSLGGSVKVPAPQAPAPQSRPQDPLQPTQVEQSQLQPNQAQTQPSTPAVSEPSLPAVVEPAPLAAEPVVTASEPVTVAPAPAPVREAPIAPAPAPVVAAPAAKPQVAPAPPPAPAAQAASTSADERKILGWPAANYTIQLLGVSNEKAARDYIASQSNRADLLLFRTLHYGKPWFVVVTGQYPSSAAARAAIAGLPAAQRDAGPWPRELRAIQTEIRAMH